MLEMGRALLLRPRLMLLDEPTLGLAPLVFKEIFRIIEDLRRRGQTILMVEQNAAKALEISDYAYVLELGPEPLRGLRRGHPDRRAHPPPLPRALSAARAARGRSRPSASALGDPDQDLRRLLALLPGHVQVGDGAEHAGPDVEEEHAALPGPRDDASARPGRRRSAGRR